MLGWLEHLHAAAHKRMLYDTETKWFGKVCPGGVVKHDQEKGPPDEVDAGIAVADMGHKPVVFLSGMFRGLQFQWATVK